MHLHLRSRRPPWWTRSGYIEQVRDIAPGGGLPGGLKDRDAELAELAEFCVSDEECLWWKAGPWAGKSALLSTFVLNPPPQSEVVSFFITARLAAQSDSTAFTDALIDQLSAIVGESVPLSLTPPARDAHRRALLRAATDKVRGEGRRLVLVVDGLDEDRGSRPGSDLASVASLLPKLCGEALQVVVASRPNPRLPDDVPADHPLRRCRVRELSVSGHATQIADLARGELQELLHGDQLNKDVLGLITACGGGLTLVELEELTGLEPYQLDGLLGGVFGRTVVGRADHAGAVSPRLYVFAHETLRETATQSLGRALDSYRDRLHTWAESYHQQNWPPDTPQYLLRGYTHMLTDLADTDRLVALAIDPARHDRMLDLTGGDTAALTEIKTCQNLLLKCPEPDLYALARLSHHRGQLESRNTEIPTGLPAVWAILGQLDRAEVIARAIADLGKQAEALAGVAVAVARAGDHERARMLVTDAEQTARTITDSHWQAMALADVAVVVARAGDHERAKKIARTLINSHWQAEVLAGAAVAVAMAGDHERAEALARTITDPHQQAKVLAGAAIGVAMAGDHERAEALARTITDPHQQAKALAVVAEAAAVAGHYQQAAIYGEQVADLLAGLRRWSWQHQVLAEWHTHPWALATLAVVVARAGDHERAEALARAIADPWLRANRLADVAVVVARAGDHERARRLVTDAEQTAHTITNPGQEANVLGEMAVVVAMAGDHERAEALARTITDPSQEAWALAVVAEAAARAGDHEQAERIAHANIHPQHQAQALADVAVVVARAGDHERARRLVTDAEQTARTITDPGQEARALAVVAEAAARAGDHEQAERIARTIIYPGRKAWALAVVAEAAARAGDHERARRLVTDAEHTAHTITNSDREANVLAGVAVAVALAGDHEQAERIAHANIHPHHQAQALAEVAVVVARAGDHERARRLVTDAEQTAHTITSSHWQAAAAVAVALAGDHERAEALARAADSWCRAETLADVAVVVARAGDHERARRLVTDAEQTAHTIFDSDREANVLADVAIAVARAGDHEQAERIARTIIYPGRKAWALAGVAVVVARAGDHERARRLATDAEQTAHTITDPDWQVPMLAKVLAEIAEAAARAGDHERARRLATDAVQTARTITGWQAQALAGVAGAVARAGDHERAEALARTITAPDRQAEALVAVAEAVGLPRAGHLLGEAFAQGPCMAPLLVLAKILPQEVIRFADAVYAADPSRVRDVVRTTSEPPSPDAR
ncbi:hypothetical protein [Streptomyces aureus]|uniref:hypothetical protein n=1 Tax=Streptomyces aureus TaxID=193461 RepID=UPI0033D6DC4E